MKKNGFTLIEIIIAIFLVATSLVGIFAAFSVVTILASESADRLTATYLAQEGLEIARNIRDTNWLRMDFCQSNPEDPSCSPSPAWDDNGLNFSVLGRGADYTYDSLVESIDASYLKKDSNGFFNYLSGSDTKFKRSFLIEPFIDFDNEADHIKHIMVVVTWDKKATILNPGIKVPGVGLCGDYNCVTAEEVLYNWYNRVNQ
jgi:type II secretory pathway pseudopilin PulG